MTSVAVLHDHLAVLRLVVAIVAAKTAREIHVTQVVGVGTPGDAHGRENISIVNVHERLCGLLNIGAASVIDAEIVRAIILAQQLEKLCLSIQPAAISVSAASSGRWSAGLTGSWQYSISSLHSLLTEGGCCGPRFSAGNTISPAPDALRLQLAQRLGLC